VKVNASLYGGSSFLSRLGDIMMLIALQSISAVTRCISPCIFSTKVRFVVSAAAVSAFPVSLSAFVDFV
jgi:hypothetical protein